jgi:hypothetical protein
VTRSKVFVVIAMTAVLAVLCATSAASAGMEEGEKSEQGGSVTPCSLVGVNPVHHPEIFSDPAIARSYGFVQGPDRVWRADGNCIAGRSGSPMAAAPASSVRRKHR